MSKKTQKPAAPVAIDDEALDKAVGAGKSFTGGRFQLDVGGHNVGFVDAYPSPPPPPPPPPPTRP